MACRKPVRSGPNKGNPATGSITGYSRHKRAGEAPCVDCVAAWNTYQSDYRQANPEAARAATRRWYRENADRARAYGREYHRKNREKRIVYARQWNARNREHQREAARRWNAENPDRVRANQIKRQQEHPEVIAEYARIRRARLRGALNIPFTAEQLQARLSMFGFHCWLCGETADTVDHVIALSAGGPHCLSNLRPACKSCNSSKGAKPWQEVAA